MAIEFGRVIPVLRMFSIEKAKEFYVGFLGFTIDWEHRFEDGLPIYMQVSRGNVVLHLSEHHGDGSASLGPSSAKISCTRGRAPSQEPSMDLDHRHCRVASRRVLLLSPAREGGGSC